MTPRQRNRKLHKRRRGSGYLYVLVDRAMRVSAGRLLSAEGAISLVEGCRASRQGRTVEYDPTDITDKFKEVWKQLEEQT